MSNFDNDIILTEKGLVDLLKEKLTINIHTSFSKETLEVVLRYDGEFIDSCNCEIN